MTNTQRYFSSIKGFRKALQEVNEKFRPEYERLVTLHARKGMYAAAGAPMSAERDALAGVVESCNRRLTAELDSFDRLTAKLSAEGFPEC